MLEESGAEWRCGAMSRVHESHAESKAGASLVSRQGSAELCSEDGVGMLTLSTVDSRSHVLRKEE